MANNKEKTYWPHMIIGFILIGVTLGYWTVKSASSAPVQESDDFMMKYQMADIHINDILAKKIAFDKAYKIELLDKSTEVIKDNVNSKIKPEPSIILTSGTNSFSYDVVKNDGSIVSDANVSFVLTRPHTSVDDQKINVVAFKDGKYTISDLNITKAGRYTLQLRVMVDHTIGYSQIPAYLQP